MNKRLLTVFAHPDDAETAVGGSLLKWVAEGWRPTLCVITDGDKGTNDPADEPPPWSRAAASSRSAPPNAWERR